MQIQLQTVMISTHKDEPQLGTIKYFILPCTDPSLQTIMISTHNMHLIKTKPNWELLNILFYHVQTHLRDQLHTRPC